MANFIIRPELNYHKEGDYELLHEALKKKHIYRVIWLQNTTTKVFGWYDLPTGTYCYSGDHTIDGCYSLTTQALAEIGKSNHSGNRDYEVLVCLYNDVRSNLKPNTDTSKRP